MITVGFASRVNSKSRKGGYLPTLRYADLTPTVLYVVTRAQRLNTDFGPTIVIDLSNEYSLFLPGRTVRSFDGPEGEEDFQALLKAINEGSVGFRKSADGIAEFVDL